MLMRKCEGKFQDFYEGIFISWQTDGKKYNVKRKKEVSEKLNKNMKSEILKIGFEIQRFH